MVLKRKVYEMLMEPVSFVRHRLFICCICFRMFNVWVQEISLWSQLFV